MKLGGKKIKGGNSKEILKEMKSDSHSDPKKKFMREAKKIAKKHT